MKQLKFMLAAATAIGLATAAQAARFSGSTDFEGSFDLAAGFTYSGTAGDNESAIIPGVPSNTVDGVLTELAESERPANHGFTSSRANLLQVNTGTEPIVRSVDGTTAGASLAGGAIYIDTLVQFTVTPKNDPVTATPGVDKLMIYLREGDDAAQLRVKACTFAEGDILSGETCAPTDVEVSAGDLNVEAGKWYRLTVKSYVVLDNLTVFEIFINGTKVSATEPMYSGAMDVFPSLLGRTDPGEDTDNPIKPTLKAVGFAGEGKVDDLVISTFDPTQTVVDFTLALVDADAGVNGAVRYSCGAQSGELAGSVNVSCYVGDTVTVTYALKSETEYSASWTGATVANNAFEVTQDTAGDTITLTISKNAPSTVDFTLTLADGVSSVKFTIDGKPYEATKAESPKTFEKLPYAALVFGKIEYADWYVAGDVKEGVSITLSADKKAETVDAKNVKTSDGGTDSFVANATTAAEAATALGVQNEVFTTGKTDADAKAVLKKGLAWATKIGAAPSALNDVQFETNGDPKKGTAAEAYLLNCEQDDVATEIAKFTVKSITFDEFNNPVFEVGNKELNDSKVADGGEYCNGHVEVRGATALDADDAFKAAKKEGDKFFKAFLVK